MFIELADTDALLKMGLGGAALYFAMRIYSRTLDFVSKKTNGSSNGNSGSKPTEFWLATIREIVHSELNSIHTFAAAPVDYWNNMNNSLDRSVTKPIASILERQTEILEKLAENAAKEEGRKL